MAKYQEECVVCGEMQEFAGPGELQEAIVEGEVGEYICQDCKRDGRDVIEHD